MNCKECYPKYCKDADCRVAQEIETTPGNCDPCRLETADILNGNNCPDITCSKGEVIIFLKKQFSTNNAPARVNNSIF